MTANFPPLLALQDQVRHARAHHTPLWIAGGGSKARTLLTGPRAANAEVIDLRPYEGILAYDPSELVIVARSGTRLETIEVELERHQQCLAFEPPRFSPDGTLGGMVASGLSGPRRLQVGPVRDFVLGASLLRSTGEVSGFGGTVMKNVAGYDVARLLAGSMGRLGPILDLSVKVLPKPQAESTLRLAMSQAECLQTLNAWCAQPLPIAASVWLDGQLTLRLAGAEAAVRLATEKLGGERLETEIAQAFWTSIRDQTHDYFTPPPSPQHSLWRAAVPSTTPPLSLPAATTTSPMIEWGGGLRWTWCLEGVEGHEGHEPATQATATHTTVRQAATAAGGHAQRYLAPLSWTTGAASSTPASAEPSLQTLAPGLLELNRRVKAAFDPEGLFNPGLEAC